MNIEGFSKEGNWYKGNTHCHTVNSDGNLSPEEVVSLYKEKGYSFLSITDHDIYRDYGDQFNDENFILIPGVEASTNLIESKGSRQGLAVHHINGLLGSKDMQYAAKSLYKDKEKLEVFNYYETWNGKEAAEKLNNSLRCHGMLTVYNHPIWSRVKEEDFIDLEEMNAIEIFNYGTEIESGIGLDTIHWDEMLRRGKKVFAIASDDNHNNEDLFDSFGGYIVVKANKLDHESIIQSILNGNYYSSSGPEIYDWGIKDGIAYVECSECQRVNFIAGNYINAGKTILRTKESPLKRAEFKLLGNELYIRAECIDKQGRIAWSNPIFL